jgi:hypothetical protein
LFAGPSGRVLKERKIIMKTSTVVTVIFLLIVSFVHLLRLIFQTKVMAGTAEIPLWMSAAACIATAALAAWLWRENKK